LAVISINTQWCKRCAICIDMCPKDVLAPDEKGYPEVVNEVACSQCKLCELYCPDLAIELLEENNG